MTKSFAKQMQSMQTFIPSFDDTVMAPLGRNIGQFRKNQRMPRKNGTVAADIPSLIDRPENFAALREEWDRLAERFEHPLLHYAWFASCAEAFCPPNELLAVVVRRHGTLVAAAPLMRTTDGGGKHVEMLGSALLCEPTGFIYSDTHALQSLIDAVLDLNVAFWSGRWKVPASDHEELTKKCSQRRTARFRHTTFSPVLPIITSWKEYYDNFSSSWKGMLRRAERRAEKLGAVTMDVLSPAADELTHYLNEIFDVEHASWKSRTKSSIRSNPFVERFFRRYTERAAAAGILRLSFLRINGTAIAAQIGIEDAQRFWVLKVGYDERFAHCSPGILLMQRTVRYAFEKGLKAFEFLGRDEQWLSMWTSHRNEYLSHWIYPLNRNGLMALVKDGGKLLAHKIKTSYADIANGKKK